ncbi:PBP1A family penicillin-binding protein [Pseudogracilibacillus sp. SO10305]
MADTKSRTARRKKQQKSKKGKKPVWKRVITYLFAFILLMFLVVGGVFAYFIMTAPKIDIDKLDVAFASQYYDQDGNQFADRGAENRIKIEYDDLPQVLIDAVTATEDVRFFEHKGIDLRRIAGAVKANFQRGFGAEGASTITQQVAENLFLTPEKSIKLKVQEQWIAMKLEREFSKEQIMEMYLNKIFYGSNAYGVAKAAEVYFGKDDLHDLTLLEAAMLAGLPQRPSAYNPFENPELMQDRVDTVLKLMVRHGKITQEEADEAAAIDVSSVLTDEKPKSFPYDAFIQQVERELEEKLEGTDINTAGLKVYTTLDTDAQEYVEFLLTDSEENPIPYPDEDLLAGVSVIDTKTGAIQAIGGSRNRENAFGSNYAINAHRQPGSVVKPLLAYGPAIEYEQWSTYHQILDEEYTPEGSNTIRNWDRQYHGWVSQRFALEQSYNVPAAKTLEEIGSDRVKEFGENLGLSFNTDVLDPRDAIGGTVNEYSPLELAGAFSAFGNEGVYTEPYAVTKVEFEDGSVVDLKPKSEPVMEDYTAYMVTDMLKDVVDRGTGTNANVSHLPIAGKTGTTNHPEKAGSNNAWFAGYSTNYTITAWTGYNDNNEILPDTQIPLHLFRHIMTELSKDIETDDFVKPDSVVEQNIVKGSNPPVVAGSGMASDSVTRELFVKGTVPDEVADEVDSLDPVSNLSATYEEDRNEIDISWDYDSDLDVSFDVRYKKDDGSMKDLTSTSDTGATISDVDDGATYTIEVVAVSKESNEKSDPASTSITINEEEEDIGEIENLQASYDASSNTISATWDYDGDGATFEVDINGQKDSVSSTSLQFSNVEPGTTYTITVTPVVDGEQGNSKSTSIDVPDDDENNNDNDNDNSNGNNQQENNENETQNNEAEDPEGNSSENEQPVNNTNEE